MKSVISDLHTRFKSIGYLLTKSKYIREVNAECHLLVHVKSGARVLKIMADDPNKTFSIAFNTIPESDAGTPHILEHSVLNGSKNFRVKSPFDVLSRGSLHTFLNAMTYPDFTIYPVASINETDYFNLMHVYLDAVFNPNLHSDPRIFLQEGWHYELTSRDSQIEYKGVVYNEMKGAFSSPERELWYQIQRNIFPDNSYRFSSGGHPAYIPALTYDAFKDFHKRNYHPSNSYIFLYGDADPERELVFIDREYLSRYDSINDEKSIPLSRPFAASKEISGYYPVIGNSTTENQSFLAMSWVIGAGYDQTTVMGLDLLADVLVNQESGPLREALTDAGIGKEVYAHSQNMQQNLLSIVVQNANGSDTEKFRKVVLDTLEKLVKGGISKESLQGSFNRMEFRLREGDDAQKGLAYNLRSISGWLFTNDPFPSLEYETALDQIKKSIAGKYFENRIREDLISNTHSLLLKLEPKPGLEKENAGKIMASLDEYQRSLSREQLDDLVNNSLALLDYQNQEDSVEALATIPLLKLADINPEPSWYDAEDMNLGGIRQLYHKEFTNSIIYMNFWFDLRVLEPALVPFIALFTELLGKLDTEHYSYQELDTALNINTGGFSASLSTFFPDFDDDKMIPEFRIRVKTTTEKLDISIGLLVEMLTRTKLDDKNRLGELLRRLESQLESSMKQNGYGIALMRLESYYSRRGAFNDMTRGIEYYWFITGLVKKYNTDPDSIIAQLISIRDILFTQGNILAGTTCSEADFKAYSRSVPSLVSSLPLKDMNHHKWNLTPGIKNEGIRTTSKVQYVVQGYDFRKLGFAWNGKWNVLSQILSTDWLQTRIRVIGGAYGGFSGISKLGSVYLASYRDPNLKETFENFRGSVGFLENFKADSTVMSRYIIGTIANLDSLLTPSEKGETAFRRLMENSSRQDMQNDRNSVLATTSHDIRNMSGIIAGILDQHVFCVYGNEEKLNSNSELFGSLVFLRKD